VTRALVALCGALVLLVAGCGGDEPQETVTGEEPLTIDASVYWLRDGKVWPARRELEVADLDERAVLEELLAGPTEQEGADLDFTTGIPEGTEVEDVAVSGETARVKLSAELPEGALAQVLYTMITPLFPAVRSVEIQGNTYTRADFEDLAPAILVESPLPFEEVTSPLRVNGTANTFEATFSYELTDTDGLIVDENFVTATSGTGTRGTFDFTTEPYTVPFDGIGALIVFERSAKDGSRINLVEIPLRMRR
jgi:hypothetical protein